jgi:hypothetical protein
MFFDSQPNFYYPYKGGIKLSKNLFRRVRFRDNINALYVASTRYTIQTGETPEIISNKKYGSPEWYWTILILNNIIDIHNDWPVSDYELDTAIEKKYGDAQNDIRFWETKTIYDGDNLVLEGGIIIEYNEGRSEQQNVNYYPSYYNEQNQLVDVFTLTTANGTVLTRSQIMTPVTNREFEYSQNENKREIFLIKPEFLTIMKEEIETLFAYDTKYKIDSAGVRFSEDP